MKRQFKRCIYVGAQGFTLVELLIVLAIIGILGAIAYPNYSEYVLRGKLKEPHAQLAQLRVKLEQYFQDRRTYVGACANGTVAPLPAASDVEFFDYSCPTLTPTQFIVRATGRAGMGTGDFVFEINEANQRSTPGAPSEWPTKADCWVRNRSGC